MVKPVAQLKRLKEQVVAATSVDELTTVVTAGLGVPEPEGDPGGIERYAAAYQKASEGAYFVHESVLKVAQRGLPSAWVGMARESATDVITAAGKGIDDSFNVLGWAARECRLLAEDLVDAKRQHGVGRPLLSEALKLLGSPFALMPGANPLTVLEAQHEAGRERLAKAREPARQGVQLMLDAAIVADQADRRFIRSMTELASEARAGRLFGDGLSAADKIVLGEAGIPGAGTTDPGVLSVVDMDRASIALDKMEPGDRERLLSLLANAKSPQERAYVLKALAAGHPMADVVKFAKVIHAFGEDARRLRNVLSPEETGASSHKRPWTQGSQPTCVAASTVFARAAVDPLYALKLTTGGYPGDPKHDNPVAFARRLRAEQLRVYDDGRVNDSSSPGMYNEEITTVADSEIGSHTGRRYEVRYPDGPTARQAALTRIESSVDDGVPVPVSISSRQDAHTIIVIGHDRTHLLVYNPWGYTYWISENDYINNHMGKVAPLPGGSDQQMSVADAVHLPR